MKKSLFLLSLVALLLGTLPQMPARAQTSEETGYTSLQLWAGGIGAFRCGRQEESTDEWRWAYTEDNAYMLWAMSKARYVWSHNNNYPKNLRDFMTSQAYAVGNGYEFRLGKQSGANDSIFVQSTSPAILSTLPNWGIAAYTIAYPNQSGLGTPAYYKGVVQACLRHWDDLIVANTLNYRTDTACIAFHMMTAARWYQFTGQSTYLTYAQRAWTFIKSRQTAAGQFKNVYGGTAGFLRNMQTLYCMAQTWSVIGDYNGLLIATVNLQNCIHITGLNAWGEWVGTETTDHLLGNGIGDWLLDNSQISFGFHYLSQFNHSSAQYPWNGHRTNRYSLNNGYVWDTWVVSAEQGYYHTGTLEANAVAWLCEWWVTQ